METNSIWYQMCTVFSHIIVNNKFVYFKIFKMELEISSESVVKSNTYEITSYENQSGLLLLLFLSIIQPNEPVQQLFV